MGDDTLYFEYRNLAERLELADDEVNSIVAEARQEFPDDDMLAELHIIRALRAAAAGKGRSQAG